MCTVTVVPDRDGFRMIVNRDERRDRPAATAPAWHRLGDCTAIYPVDPHSGGTWVGLNDRGLAATLLNRTPDGARAGRTFPRSRGLVIPPLLACASLAEALDKVATVDPGDFDQFRLLIVEPMSAAVVTSDGLAMTSEPARITEPFLLTSSGLGDSLVEAPRRRLFESLVLQQPRSDWLAAQARFHAHRWRARPEISVRMSRADARTVSRTIVRVTSSVRQLRYYPLRAGGGPDVRAA